MGSSQLQSTTPATDNGVRDGRSNWLVAPPTLQTAVPPELHVLHSAMRAAKSQDSLHWESRERATFGVPGQRTACAATQGIKGPNNITVSETQRMPQMCVHE